MTDPHQPGACPRCGTAFAPGQEYCLECGLRLPGRSGPFSGLAAAWARRGWYPGDWVWPVLVFLILAGLGALAAIVLSTSGNADTINAVPSSTGSMPVVTQPAPPTETTPTVTQPPPTTTAPPRTTPKPPGALTDWPAEDGYTVILQSIPAGAGRSNAVRTARQALAAGLPRSACSTRRTIRASTPATSWSSAASTRRTARLPATFRKRAGPDFRPRTCARSPTNRDV